MILSMTGFGKAVTDFQNKKITVEIKSLNSKQLDLSVRLPQAYKEIELDIRSLIAKSLERGKVEVFIFSESSENAVTANVNIQILAKYKQQILEMANKLGLPEPEDWYSTLLRLPEALKVDAGNSLIDEAELKAVNDTVKQAIEALISFRTQEGIRLCTFFKEKIANIQNLLNEVAPYEKERVEKIKGRIQDSLAKLDDVNYDCNRFEQEMIYYIEKLDINEEKLRLQNHLDYFLETMENGHGQGKKLGFISQEMGREINTLGSKSNHAELQKIVVRMKDQLEQIKEQVLNIM